MIGVSIILAPRIQADISGSHFFTGPTADMVDMGEWSQRVVPDGKKPAQPIRATQGHALFSALSTLQTLLAIPRHDAGTEDGCAAFLSGPV